MRWPAVLSLLLLGTLTACGPEPGGTPADGAERGAALPRQVTADERVTLSRAEEILERRCLARAGFDVPAPPERGRTELAPPAPALVLSDLAYAREHGYGPRVRTPEETARLLADDPVGDYLRALSPKRRAQALRAWQGGGVDTVEVTLPSGMTRGRSSRGCTSEARGELYGDFRTWFGVDAVDQGVTALAMDRAQEDPAFTGALRGWSHCVAVRGLPHESPRRLRDALGDSAPRAKEIEYAVAEAECAVSSTLAEIAPEVEERHLARIRARYLVDVTNARRMRLAALAKAVRIVREDETAPDDTTRHTTRRARHPSRAPGTTRPPERQTR
ncbi:hypothetical protein [Streptomyces galbus]|uniref:Lipoprotein n=1 Tax=Streptomyces galbus TaxID=33898 RepID=A0A4U5WWT1_STRGB|nr:hypothetical protein [Streptomyces galbus]TKT06750.1 hypothetical protein E4U92_26070 [Streptomyces galbus]GHD49254.1 hypothetical protein GCM10010335_58770 [Streptomyces galbus]